MGIILMFSQDTWFSKGRVGRPATGFLEERLRNVRKMLRRSSGRGPQREQEPVHNRLVMPGNAMSQVCLWYIVAKLSDYE